MLISRQRQFIFIHIYKNAGTSVTNALLPFASCKWQYLLNKILKKLSVSTSFNPEPFPSHIKASELICEIGKENFESFFSFAIVRNPWDWQVSLYKFMLKNTKHPQHGLAKKFVNFDEYIRWRCTEEVRFQKDFIYSKDGELLVDFVGKFENINTDFQIICERIGLSATLPMLNVSNTKPYRQFYKKESKELVRRTFESDIRLFGYEF